MSRDAARHVSTLRQTMEKHGVAACIIPSADPHLSEYPADHWKARQWLSGFDGSAGTLIVTANAAGLWTDSRYYLQAEKQLNTGIELYRDGLPDTPGFMQWLSANLPENSKIAIDGKCISTQEWRESAAQYPSLQLTDLDLIPEIWTDRPALPAEPFFNLDIKYAGRSVTEKLSDLRTQMRRQKAGICLLTALDDIAWLLNIRGKDMLYNPVVTAFAVVEMEQVLLFTSATPTPLSREEECPAMVIAPYSEIYSYFSANTPACLVDVAKTNFSLYKAVSGKCKIIETASPVSLAKCIKNETEIAGFRRAMEKDGVAMLRFMRWLENALADGKTVTELSAAEQLRIFRAGQPLFSGESFATIAGYGANGAIVHYSATPESNATLRPEGFLLLDSGGQYLDGTTDITRTIAPGALKGQQKRDFTLVLKGHIALATAHFPEGTQGIQLDILARQALWNNGLNYGHGTGHGVGHFLCVHEYPPAISPRRSSSLQAGMVLSNEPGLYREGEYGIRTENLMLVVPAHFPKTGEPSGAGSQAPSEGSREAFLCFETLTLCPIDLRAIDFGLLTESEKQWLNSYHQTVYERLSPFLNEEEKRWLAEKAALSAV